MYLSWLTPTTMVGVSSVAGAEITTFLTPPLAKWAMHFSVVKYAPVHSATYWTPASAHGIFDASRVQESVMRWPFRMSAPSSATHVPLNRPWTVSCSSRYFMYSALCELLMCLMVKGSPR